MFVQLKQRLAFIMINARWRAIPQSLISCMVAICSSLSSPNFNLLYSIMATIGVVSAHLSANLLDDIFDYIQDKVCIRNKAVSGRTLKCENILNKTASIKDFVIWACGFGGIAVCIGLYFLFKLGLPILYFIILGAFLAIFYSAPPLKLSYRALGELVIGLMFGPLLVCGVCFVLTHEISSVAIITSLMTGLLATSIVYVHSIIDTEVDKLCEKTTLAVALKTKTNQLIALAIFIFTPYFLAFLISPILGLVLLTTLPFAIYLMNIVNDSKRHKILFRTLPKKAWKVILKYNNEYFYTRWLYTRNFMTLFVGIVCVYFIIKAIIR